jgi:hypothetical protein
MGKLVYLVERLKEPGSHRALMFLAGIFQVPGVEVDNWMGVATLIAGSIAVFLPESTPAQKIKGFSK